MIPAPSYNHVRNYTFPSLIHCLVDAYTVITVDIYFSCITSIRYLCASVADKGSEGLCAVCIMAKIMNSENHASSCRCKTDGLFASNTSSVCPERIICFLQTHHLFPSNASSVFLKRIILLFFPFFMLLSLHFLFLSAPLPFFFGLSGRYTIVYLIFLLFILCPFVGCRGGCWACSSC